MKRRSPFKLFVYAEHCSGIAGMRVPRETVEGRGPDSFDFDLIRGNRRELRREALAAQNHPNDFRRRRAEAVLRELSF
jgi:hypothetical protein